LSEERKAKPPLREEVARRRSLFTPPPGKPTSRIKVWIGEGKLQR